ncbi:MULTISPECIES: acyl carrier protein [unclassified Streptomyces]|uniref:acyl carrier protein n=1 Tax=unclassified Streptomyces TaxID=2593676 RepID=UPI002E29EE91|nr:acyl carrier protein [Streptomyces sp. NBC_00223]
MTAIDPKMSARIRQLVVESCESEITEEDFQVSEGALSALNYTSLAYIRLLDAIENEFGVYIDLETTDPRLTSVGGITEVVAEELAAANA